MHSSLRNIFENTRVYLWAHCILAIWIFLCFMGGLNNFFAGDDFDWLFDAVKLFHHPFSIFKLQGIFVRPLETLFFFCNLAVAGANPLFHHLASLLVHIANVILVSCFINYVCNNRLAGLIGALYWGLNYKHSEVVFMSYAISDAQVLLMFLGAFLLFFRRQLLLTTTLFMIGLLAKENAVVFPGILFLYICLCREDHQRQWLKRTTPLWCVACGYLVMRYSVSAGGGGSSYLSFTWDVFPRFWENLLSLIGPDATFVKQVWFSTTANLLPVWFAISLFLLAAVVWWTFSPIYRFGCVWIGVTMLPTLFIFYQTSRYRYIPLVGLAILVGQGVSELLMFLHEKHAVKICLKCVYGTFILILGYFIIGIYVEEQDYDYFGAMHRQAAESFQQDILPHIAQDRHIMAVFFDQDSMKWSKLLQHRFSSKPWYVPATYKWVYRRPHGVLGLSNTYGFVSYCAYNSQTGQLFVNVPYKEYQEDMLEGNFYIINHDSKANTFSLGDAVLKKDLIDYSGDHGLYRFLQPGQFDPTGQGGLDLHIASEY